MTACVRDLLRNLASTFARSLGRLLGRDVGLRPPHAPETDVQIPPAAEVVSVTVQTASMHTTLTLQAFEGLGLTRLYALMR